MVGAHKNLMVHVTWPRAFPGDLSSAG